MYILGMSKATVLEVAKEVIEERRIDAPATEQTSKATTLATGPEDAPQVNLDDLNPDTGYPWTKAERKAAKGLHKPLPKVDVTPDETTALGLGIVGIKGFSRPPSEENAVEWAERAARRLLPDAMAALAIGLRDKNTKTRLEAADKVLRMNGIDRKEAQHGGNATLILKLEGGSGGVAGLDWLQPVDVKATKK